MVLMAPTRRSNLLRVCILVLACVGILMLFTLVSPAGAATAPTFGSRVITNDGSGTLFDSTRRNVTAEVKNSGAASSKDSVLISGPLNGTRAKTWMLYAKSRFFNGGKRFPLAKLRTTVTFELKSESYTERIWNYDFDRYFNICVKGLKDVTAEGGNIYCSVYHAERVRYSQATKIIKNYPRPKVVSNTVDWPNPICTIGTTRVDTTLLLSDSNQVCQAGQATSNENEVPGCKSNLSREGYPQSTTTLALIPQIAGRPKSVSTTFLDCNQTGVKGPGWVETSVTTLPAPTVVVTSITGPDYIGYFTIAGTVVNNYRSATGITICITNTAGTLIKLSSLYLPYNRPGFTETWIYENWRLASDGTPTTTATAGFYSCS
jgi:hypothetical protein